MHIATLRNQDSAVSPVVGTILMVAVTVALAATVLTVMSGFGNENVTESTDAVFKAQAIDTNGNGKTDVIKITYVSGPTNLPNGDVSIRVEDSSGTAVTNSSTSAWNPGDFRIFNPSSGGSYFVTVSVLGSTMLDTTARLDE